MPRPTILISSTLAGFDDLRGALYFELSRRGFQPYLSEEANFPLTGEYAALQECLQVARNVDFYLLMIGPERGTRLNGNSSPTREEFRAAREAYRAGGRPRLILTVRSATREAVARAQQPLPTPDLEDPDFTDSFVQEVESFISELDHNYLVRFGSFTDLMAVLETRLQLGANDAELVSRRAIIDELLDNITILSTRSDATVIARHEFVGRAREAIDGDVLDIAGLMTVTREIGNSLGEAFLMFHAKRLRTHAMRQALIEGTFRRFNAQSGGFVAGPIHAAMDTLVSDIEDLLGLVRRDSRWLDSLGELIRAANLARTPEVTVPGHSVVYALAYYDRAQNVFQGLVALVRHLMGLSDQPAPDGAVRRPQSPVPDEAQRLHAESVDREEIEKLLRNGVMPFGDRIPRSWWNRNRDEFLSTMADDVVKDRQNTAEGLALGMDALREVVVAALPDAMEGLIAGPEDALEVRERPPRRPHRRRDP